MGGTSIVIPVRDGLNRTKQILDQLRNIDIKKEILIIDDNSNQETKDWLKEQLDIRLFTYDYDIGVSQARNLGYSEAKYDKVLIINNDLVFAPNCIQELSKALDDPDIDIACPGTTEGPRKFELPIVMRKQNICGRCFMVRKGLSCFPIPSQLDLWYGDDWIRQMTDKSRIKEVETALVHHYVSSTIGLDGKRSLDVEERIAGDTFEFAKMCHEKGWNDERFNNIKRDD